MSTHAAFALTRADGMHECLERMIDTPFLPDIVWELFRGGPFDQLEFKDLSADFKRTPVEYNNQREHQHHHFFHMNFKKKEIVCSVYVDDAEASSVVSWIGEESYRILKDRGWTFKIGNDCAHPKGGEEDVTHVQG